MYYNIEYFRYIVYKNKNIIMKKPNKLQYKTFDKFINEARRTDSMDYVKSDVGKDTEKITAVEKDDVNINEDQLILDQLDRSIRLMEKYKQVKKRIDALNKIEDKTAKKIIADLFATVDVGVTRSIETKNIMLTFSKKPKPTTENVINWEEAFKNIRLAISELDISADILDKMVEKAKNDATEEKVNKGQTPRISNISIKKTTGNLRHPSNTGRKNNNVEGLDISKSKTAGDVESTRVEESASSFITDVWKSIKEFISKGIKMVTKSFNNVDKYVTEASKIIENM